MYWKWKNGCMSTKWYKCIGCLLSYPSCSWLGAAAQNHNRVWIHITCPERDWNSTYGFYCMHIAFAPLWNKKILSRSIVKSGAMCTQWSVVGYIIVTPTPSAVGTHFLNPLPRALDGPQPFLSSSSHHTPVFNICQTSCGVKNSRPYLLKRSATAWMPFSR